MQDSLQREYFITALTALSVLLSQVLPVVTLLLDPLCYRNYRLEQPHYIFLLQQFVVFFLTLDSDISLSVIVSFLFC